MTIFNLLNTTNRPNPSANGVFEYGWFDSTVNTFTPFNNYGYIDGSGVPPFDPIGVSYDSSKILAHYSSGGGNEEYPHIAFENIQGNINITPQPFPTNGIYLHPAGDPVYQERYVAVKLNIPISGTLDLTGIVQRASSDGNECGFQIKSGNTVVLNRIRFGQAAPSPNNTTNPVPFSLNGQSVSVGDSYYFIVDTGGVTTGVENPFSDDVALDITFTVIANKILSPIINTSPINCSTTSLLGSVIFQQNGTATLYDSNNAVVSSTSLIPNGSDSTFQFNSLNFSSYGGQTLSVIISDGVALDSDPTYILVENINCSSAILNNDVYSTLVNTPVTIDVKANDTINCTGTITYQVSNVQNGTMTIDANGIVTATPSNNYVGNGFTGIYEVFCDGTSLGTATITVDVTCVVITGGNIIGDTNVTVNNPYTYTITGLSGTTPFNYNWTVTNAILNSGQNTDTISVTPISTNAIINLSVGNCGNPKQFSVPLNVKVNCTPTINIKLNCYTATNITGTLENTVESNRVVAWTQNSITFTAKIGNHNYTFLITDSNNLTHTITLKNINC